MTLNHTEYGAENTSAKTLIILHGLFGSGRNWVSVAKKLADTYRVITVDLPNHGGSPWTDEVSYEAMADDVGEFLYDHDLNGATLMGHSMGGKAAMTLALSEPDLVGSLIVVDIAPVIYKHTNEDWIDAMLSVDLANLEGRNDADAELAKLVDDPALRGFFLLNLVRGDDGFAWRLNLAALKAGMANLVGMPDDALEQGYEGRTLFIDGALSDYIKPHHHGEIYRLFGNVQILEIEGAGHWVHAEQPAKLIDAVRNFLG